MTANTRYGAGYPAPGALVNVSAKYAAGRVRVIASAVAIVNADGIGSLLMFGRIPSDAIILPSSTLYHEDVTSVTDFDIGFGQNGTPIGNHNELSDGLDIHTAGTKGIMTSVTTANLGKRAWELAGLSSDPGGLLDIIGTLNVAATASKNVFAHIAYSKN